jgi:hypothetical protein
VVHVAVVTVVALDDYRGRRADWRHRAACNGMDRDLFFPEQGNIARTAKHTCCPVREPWLDYTPRNRDGADHGPAGGGSVPSSEELAVGGSVPSEDEPAAGGDGVSSDEEAIVWGGGAVPDVDETGADTCAVHDRGQSCTSQPTVNDAEGGVSGSGGSSLTAPS